MYYLFNHLLRSIVTILVSLCVFNASAQTKDVIEFQKKFEQKLNKVSPAFVVESVDKSPIDDFFEVKIKDGPLLYVDKAGRFMFSGDLFELSDNSIVNLSDEREAKARLKLMDQVKSADAIVFSPKPPKLTKANIYVFTDVDCGYCRKLHLEVPTLNDAGISVHYLAFPRAGIGSPSYKKIATAWCVPNRNETLTKLKNRQPVKTVECQSPVNLHYDIGQKMGINGTPAILLEDGSLIPGYKPAADLIKLILAN